MKVGSDRCWNRALVGLVLASALVACPKPSEKPEDGGATVGEIPSASSSPGLRVSLPPGWLAQADGPDALVIGPQGRAVMRIARSDLSSVPAMDKLQRLFSSELKGATVEPLEASQDADRVMWRARLTAPKSGRGWTVALGAKQVGRTVYLCSTVPGATDGEVQAAAESCLHLGQ